MEVTYDSLLETAEGAIMERVDMEENLRDLVKAGKVVVMI